jgi:predicted transcriptional regulator
LVGSEALKMTTQRENPTNSSVQFQRLNKKRLLKEKRKKETFEYRKEVYVYQPMTGATGNV